MRKHAGLVRMLTHGGSACGCVNLEASGLVVLGELILRPWSYITLFLSLSGVALAAEAGFEPAGIIDDYVAVSKAQQNRLQGASMEMDIEAEVPNLHRHGRLHALRRISSLGRITYDALRFEGDRSIKNDVIARYLSAEAEALRSAPAALAVTPANYKFKYKGLIDADGRKVIAFHVTPRKKRVGLFVGELWLDPETHLPLRESGRFVKNPSIFVRKIEFVRDYQIRDGVAIPSRHRWTVETRIVGKANLSVAYSSVSLAGETPTIPGGDSQ